MPHISRNRLDKQQEKKLVTNFFLVLSKITKTDAMERFLLSLLSPTEQLMLAKRLGMFLLIKEGYSDSEVEKILHITRVTVSRFRYFLATDGAGFEIAWQTVQDEHLKQEVNQFLLALAAYAARAAGGRVKSTIL